MTMRFMPRAQQIEAEPLAPPPASTAARSREALAAAITAHADAERIAQEAHAAAKTAADASLEAGSAWRAAQSEAVAARSNQTMTRIDVASAIAREGERMAEVRAAKAAAAILADHCEGPDRQLRAARARCDKAARAIVAAEAGELLDEIANLRMRYIDRLAALSVVERALDPFADAETALAIRAAFGRAATDNPEKLARIGHPANAAWSKWLDGLKAEPSLPRPE